MTGFGRGEAEAGGRQWVVEMRCVNHRYLDLKIKMPKGYAGLEEPYDPVAGHIPGAINRDWTLNLDPEGKFVSQTSLQSAFNSILDESRPSEVIVYCGSGVTACHNILAMEYAGLTGARLYAGSWSEWCSDPDRPVTPSSGN